MIISCKTTMSTNFGHFLSFALQAIYENRRAGDTSYLRLVEANTFKATYKSGKDLPDDAVLVPCVSACDGKSWLTGALYMNDEKGAKHIVTSTTSMDIAGEAGKLWDTFAVNDYSYQNFFRRATWAYCHIDMRDNKSVSEDFIRLDYNMDDWHDTIVKICHESSWLSEPNRIILDASDSDNSEYPDSIKMDKDIHWVVDSRLETCHDDDSSGFEYVYADSISPLVVLHMPTRRIKSPFRFDWLGKSKREIVNDGMTYGNVAVTSVRDTRPIRMSIADFAANPRKFAHVFHNTEWSTIKEHRSNVKSSKAHYNTVASKIRDKGIFKQYASSD